MAHKQMLFRSEAREKILCGVQRGIGGCCTRHASPKSL